MALTYRFGEFRLVPATRELWRGDAPVAVPPRAFDCIVYLVEHRERAVGRDELIAAVWGRTETGDGTLGQTVLAARRALEDTGKEQHAIRTVFRFGYHWVAPVDVGDEAPTETVHAPAASVEQRDDQPAPMHEAAQRKRPQVAILVGAAALAIAVIVFAGLHAWRTSHVPSATKSGDARGSIALVLPVTVSAGTGYDWVRLGLMDLIGARLRSAGLPVVPSDNVVALTGRTARSDAAATAASLSRATGATLVVDPRAESLDGRWRVTLRTTLGRDPPLAATGESPDVLAAARSAADELAQSLGYTPTQVASSEGDPLAVANLSQQIEAAMLSDRLDAARALVASATPEQRALPELRLRLAQIEYQAGNFDAAEAGFNAVADAAPAEQDPVLHARAVQNLGVIAAMRDDPKLARRRFDEAIALLRTQHAPDALGKALNGRANINGIDDDYDAALRDFSEARAAFESSGNLLALAVLDSNLAAMDEHRYHYAEAEPVFRRAADRFATFGVNAAELNALNGSAELKLALLEPDSALALAPRLADLVAKVADPARKRGGELMRIEIIAANGRLEEASSSLAKVLAEADEASDRGAVTHGHMIAARLAAERGDARAAAAEAATALRSATVADDARERARMFRLRIRALIDAGDVGTACRELDDFTKFADADGSPPARFYARLATADCAAAGGEASAGATYAGALADADALRIPLDIREAAGAYSAWLLRGHDLAGASAAAERVAAWSQRDYDSALVQLRVQHALGDAALWRTSLTRTLALAGERAIPADLSTLAATP
ncbi:MAG TPA: winged helix-turn-helix domain-containing protein [Rhodanobacteraceae bacterium]|nr:winged helix-turn-helix domain-containing protein [Rhodanobacteraceae bacterium]